MAFAHDLPVVPISTLAALAQQCAKENDHIASAIDARMQEIYWGLYKKDNSGIMQPINEEQVSSPSELNTVLEGNWFGAGSGWNTYPEELKSKFDGNLLGFNGEVYPAAVDILSLAKPAYLQNQAISVEAASPVYLRNKIANKN